MYSNFTYKIIKLGNIKPRRGTGEIHFERAAADLVSNPIINVSIGTKMPPPPTPPTVPNAEPRNPMTVARTSFQLNFNFCPIEKIKKYTHILTECNQQT